MNKEKVIIKNPEKTSLNKLLNKVTEQKRESRLDEIIKEIEEMENKDENN